MSGTDGKLYDTHLYTAKGVYEICRWSRQTKANAFYDFVYEVLESLRTNKATLVPTVPIQEYSSASPILHAKQLLDLLSQYKGVLNSETNQVIQAHVAMLLTGKQNLPVPVKPPLTTKQKAAKGLMETLVEMADMYKVPRPGARVVLDKNALCSYWQEVIPQIDDTQFLKDFVRDLGPGFKSDVMKRIIGITEKELEKRSRAEKWYATAEIAEMSGCSIKRVAMVSKANGIRTEKYSKYAPLNPTRTGSTINRIVYNEKGKQKLLELLKDEPKVVNKPKNVKKGSRRKSA